MTPAQHKTAAEAALTTATTPSDGVRMGPSNTDWMIIEAHANLAQAAGTGTHYTDAETALNAISPNTSQANLTRDNLARTARAHSLLADR